jgi:hypothetical protein
MANCSKFSFPTHQAGLKDLNTYVYPRGDAGIVRCLHESLNPLRAEWQGRYKIYNEPE